MTNLHDVNNSIIEITKNTMESAGVFGEFAVSWLHWIPPDIQR